MQGQGVNPERASVGEQGSFVQTDQSVFAAKQRGKIIPGERANDYFAISMKSL